MYSLNLVISGQPLIQLNDKLNRIHMAIHSDMRLLKKFWNLVIQAWTTTFLLYKSKYNITGIHSSS